MNTIDYLIIIGRICKKDLEETHCIAIIFNHTYLRKTITRNNRKNVLKIQRQYFFIINNLSFLNTYLKFSRVKTTRKYAYSENPVKKMIII